MYEDQIASIVSLKKLSAYEEPYNLYEVSIDYDYDLDALTGEPCRTDQGYLDAAVARVLDAHEGEQGIGAAWEALKASAQEPNPDDITSNTQWSIVYDNTRRTAAFTLRRHWGDVFDFSVDGVEHQARPR